MAADQQLPPLAPVVILGEIFGASVENSSDMRFVEVRGVLRIDFAVGQRPNAERNQRSL